MKSIFAEEVEELSFIEKSRLPKYLERIPDGKGCFKYIYFDDKGEKKRPLNPLIDFTVEKPLQCNINNAEEKGETFIKNWAKDWKENPQKAKIRALNNSTVKLLTTTKNKISLFHFAHKRGGVKRSKKEIYERALLLPIAKKMLEGENLCKVNEVRKHKDYVEYELVGKTKINNIEREVSVIISKRYGSKKVYISTINKAIPQNEDMAFINDVCFTDSKTLTNLVKLNSGIPDSKSHLKESRSENTQLSIGKLQRYASGNYSSMKPEHNPVMSKSLIPYKSKSISSIPTGFIKGTSDNSTIPQNNKKSTVKLDYNGENMLNKSFSIDVTEITEKNKNHKVMQLQKALYAMYDRIPFVINHVKADKKSERYDDITLNFTSFDKSKIEKAVHKMAFSLNAQLKTSKGEAFNFKAQEQLTDKLVKEISAKSQDVYSFVINYFGLPEIRIVSKSDVIHKGKIIYNPETGQPLKKSEWQNFVNALEKFLNRNYNGIGEKIVLSAETLGRLLDRMSKNTSFSKLKKLPLEDLQEKGKSFDWISESIKNMQNTFGESISRQTAGRIQIAIDSAAQRVTNVSDKMRNSIQQIIIDGIKDKKGKSKISQELFDKCAELNRDIQRITDTEIQNNTNNAYLKEEVYNAKEGEKVYFKRFEIIDDNTCKKCKQINGKIALWSDVPLPDEKINDTYADYAIWEGKTEGKLPNGTIHCYCRGSWYRYYPEVGE